MFVCHDTFLRCQGKQRWKADAEATVSPPSLPPLYYFSLLQSRFLPKHNSTSSIIIIFLKNLNLMHSITEQVSLNALGF